jgi:dipeptidase D
MVCQANAGTVHDFELDPIRPVIRDGWVVAEHTTLGADNGIGVALALAALEEPGLAHPALEVLLTVNEETGMFGARDLTPGALRGRTLINLDTEEWGHFYLGCAGGVDVKVRQTLALDPIPAGYAPFRLAVAGLKGGHSGIDIHLGRGNALKLLGEALAKLASCADLRLIRMQGGTARNAIPRESEALCAAPTAALPLLTSACDALRAEWQVRFAEADPALGLTLSPAELSVPQALTPAEVSRLLAWLSSAPNGVDALSADFPGVVETSDNLGVLALEGNALRATYKVRSLVDARADVLGDRLIAHAQAHGFDAHKDGAYPGWKPNPASPALALCRRVYEAEFGQPAHIQVIHAGLECGLFAASHPHLDMISFGPDIRGAHAPGERVEIASVERCWRLLKAVLATLARI